MLATKSYQAGDSRRIQEDSVFNLEKALCELAGRKLGQCCNIPFRRVVKVKVKCKIVDIVFKCFGDDYISSSLYILR